MYDIHGLEVLQSIVEARAGGETGVKSVQFLDEPALWRAAKAGAWSPELADAAMAAELGPGQPTLRELLKTEGFNGSPPHGILIDYKDGLRGIVLKVGQSGIRWNFACRLQGQQQPLATSFYVGPWQNRNLFKALSHAIQTHFRNGEAPYPVERTLLTTGIVCAAVDSFASEGARQDTPQLEFAYSPRDFRAMREMGKTWDILTEDTPEPRGITRGGHRG
jgi:hypothetical protein